MTFKPLMLCTAMALVMGNANAGEREELLKLKSTTLNLIEALVEEGVLSRESADALLKRAEQSAEAEIKQRESKDAEPRDVVRVPYVPEFVRDEIRDEVRAELREDVVNDVMAQAKTERWGVPQALPEWISRIKFKGDMRLRAQSDIFDGDNDEFGYFDFQEINDSGGIGETDDPFLNTTNDRHRQRARLRLAMDAKVSNNIKVGMRVTTGNSDDPVSTNQTLGNSNNRWDIVLDQAYLNYNGFDTEAYPWLTFQGGRIPNPWFSTDLVWDRDLGFEGFAATYRKNLAGSSSLLDQDDRSRTLFMTVGAFPMEEVELSSRDKWLFGAQLGTEWVFNNQSSFKLGLAYYDFHNITGRKNSLNGNKYDFTAPEFVQKGNTLFDINNDSDPGTNLFALASDYDEINVTASLDFALFSPTHIILTADYVKNIGYDRDEVEKRTGQSVDNKTDGYQVQLSVGWPQVRKARDWQVFGAYKYLERDAVLDAFTDSDFHLGGTDAEGWILGGSYGLARNTWLTGRWLSADEIDGPLPFPSVSDPSASRKLGIDIFQLDLNAKF